MSMEILILNGSPRPNGNTAAMVRAYAEGAAEAGHTVHIVDQKSFLQYLHLEDCGMFAVHGEENRSPEVLERLRQAGRDLKD